MEAGFTKETVLRTSLNRGSYYNLPSVPCAYFSVIVSGLCDENIYFT